MGTMKYVEGDVAVSRDAIVGGHAIVRGNARVGHNLTVEGWLDAPNIKVPNKGYFKSEADLKGNYPHPRNGWWALVGESLPAPVYIALGGKWTALLDSEGDQVKGGETDIDAKKFEDELDGVKEEVSGIRTTLTAHENSLYANSTRVQIVEGKVAQLIKDVETILGEGATEAIENFAEILAFLTGCTDDETLQGLLNTLRTAVGQLREEVQSTRNAVEALNHLPFSGIVYKTSEVSAKTPGTIWFSLEHGGFFSPTTGGGVHPAPGYNAGEKVRTDRIYVCGSSLYRAAPDAEGATRLYLFADERTAEDLQAQIDTAVDVSDTRYRTLTAAAKLNAETVAALDAKVSVEAFDGPLASDSGEGVWFDDGSGKFVVKAEDGKVSDAGAEYNWIPTPELVGIGAVAHARTDKVYRDGKGGLWRVAYDAEAENYVLLAYVDEATLEQKVSSAEARLETALDTAKGRITELEDSVERIGILDFAGSLASLDWLESAEDGKWFVEQPGAFYAKLGEKTALMGAPYNVVPTPDEAELGATVHVRTDLVYRRVSDGRLFHAVATPDSANGPYRMEAFIDAADSRSMLASMDQQSDQKVAALRKATGVYPFDILVEHVNELGTGSLPGSIAYVIGSNIFYRKDSSGDWEPAGTDYNNAGGTGPSDNVFRFCNVLYVRSGFSGGLTSLVSSKELTSRLASKADTEELSNVLAGEAPAPGTVTLPDFKTYTREELKKDLFIDMWNSVWTVRCKFNHMNDPLKDHVLGKYDPENAPDAQHSFRAYDDVWLSYEEALRVIEEYQWAPGQTNLDGCLQTAHSRVAVPFTFGAHGGVSLASIAVYNEDIEELCFAFGVSYSWDFQITKLDTAFHCTRSRLRKIHGILPVRGDCTFNGWVSGAVNLESFRLWGLAKDIEMASCPKLDLETFRYMITKAANTKAITITVHPEVYAKIGDEGNADWHALLELSASKNITIASA